MSDKIEKTRVTLTLTKVYVDALDLFVESGLYLEYQDLIRAALRHFFESRGVKAFCPETAETQGEG